MPNKYISQYTEKTDAISTDLFLIQRGSVYYKQKRSSLFAVLDGYIPLTGSSLITGDLKYTKGSAANFGTADNYGLNIQQNSNTYIAIGIGGNITINSALTLIGSQTFSNTGITKSLSLGGETGTVRGASSNIKLKLLDITTNSYGFGFWSDGSNSGLELNLDSFYVDYRIYQGA